MTPIRDVGVIIVAAGGGTRVHASADERRPEPGGGEGRPGSTELKQFRWVAGKPMLLHSVQAFQRRPDVALVVAVLPRQFAGDPPPWLFQSDLERLMVSVGGKERGDSVWAGIEDLPDEAAIVVIHDAARPLVTDETIDRVVAQARLGTGAVAALPVVDTLKQVSADGRVECTVPRTGLWRAQTPQAFPRAMIERAYFEAMRDRFVATDDSALCERLHLPVVVVPGSERAMKVTEEGDFARADLLATGKG